jgi:phospholipid/cholesterol/gamma-HCH transport system ATP-binding protein
MISIRGLRVAFGDQTIIDGIDLEVAKGSTHVILGMNGSGKTVLLKCVAGLIGNYSGEISINGQDIKQRHKSADGLEHGIHPAYVFQRGGLFDSMSVFDNVAFGLRRIGYSEDEVRKRVLSVLARVGLQGEEDKAPRELSGGMQKRAGIARAVCMEPGIMLYDDPTAGLDPVLSDSIAVLITEIKASLETSEILVTHDLAIVGKVAEAVSLIYDGKVVFHGSRDDFFSCNDLYVRQFIEGSEEGPFVSASAV